MTRVSTKIHDGSISEINQCRKSNIFTKCVAFNPKVHNLTQILLISAPLIRRKTFRNEIYVVLNFLSQVIFIFPLFQLH